MQQTVSTTLTRSKILEFLRALQVDNPADDVALPPPVFQDRVEKNSPETKRQKKMENIDAPKPVIVFPGFRR